MRLLGWQIWLRMGGFVEETDMAQKRRLCRRNRYGSEGEAL